MGPAPRSPRFPPIGGLPLTVATSVHFEARQRGPFLMPQVFASLALRLSVCLAVCFALWRFLGPIGLAVSAPLFGVLLAKPLFELADELRLSAKTLAYFEIEGRNFEHRGFRLDIAEDDRRHRWISINDVRKLIPSLPRPAVLRAQFPDGVQEDPAISGHRIHDDALLEYLAKSTDANSLKFRNWLEREVVLPGTQVRKRLGIREEPPSATE